MKDKIGQLFFIGLEGKTLGAHEADFIVKNNIAGVTLFGRNVESPKQIHQLCTDLQKLRHKSSLKAPLFIAIDMEGGRVARLKAPFTVWPAVMNMSKLDSTSLAFRFAQAMGQELRAVGVNLDFAPCIDVLTNEKNVLIGDRSLGSDPEHVAKMASAIVRGYIKAGIIPCAKHFPGHGNTVIDSHEDLPVETANLERLREVELHPFKKVFRARLDLVMTAHIKFPNVDPEWPVTLSEIFMKKILRDEMKYRELAISDDLDMKALASHFPKELIPVRALQAGCDLLLYCNDFTSPPMALEAVRKALADKKLDAAALEASLAKVLALKKEVLAQPDPLPFEEATKIIGHPDHLRLSKAIAEGQVPADLMTT